MPNFRFHLFIDSPVAKRKGTIVTDLQEGAVCGIDGCAPGDIGSTTKARTSVKKNLSIYIISDAICPWCWVAKRRLDRALASLAPDIVANVTWHPFELNPGMPKAGLDRRAYRSRKFGTWEHSQALDAQVAATAKPDGLDFLWAEHVERCAGNIIIARPVVEARAAETAALSELKPADNRELEAA